MLSIEFKFPEWADQVKKHYMELMREVAASIQTNRGELFDQEGSHNGKRPWKPLKLRQGQILSKTGQLRRSLAPRGTKGTAGPSGILKFSNDVVTIGTTVKYAAVHNYGAVIRPKRKKVLSWTVGKKRYFAKEVTIPKRPFLEGAWSDEDQQEIESALLKKVSRILNMGAL